MIPKIKKTKDFEEVIVPVKEVNGEATKEAIK
jgi:hypothetical protein